MASQDLYEASRLMLENDFKGALAMYRRLQAAPTCHARVACMHNAALCLELMQETHEALEDYQLIMSLAPGYERAVLGACSCMQQLGVPAHERLALLRPWRSNQARRMLCQASFEIEQDYNPSATAIYLDLARHEGGLATTHFAQAFYDNLVGKQYWLTDPLPAPPPMLPPTAAPTVLMLTNAAYSLLTLNCIESVRQNAPALIEALAVYATDDVAFAFLVRHAPGIRIVLWPTDAGSELSTYCQSAFNNLVRQKVALIHAYLRSGRTTMFTDGDVVFLSDPMPHLSGTCLQQDGPGLACTGFMHLQPAVAYAFDPALYPPDCGDQPTTNALLECPTLLSRRLFANGRQPLASDTVVKHYNFMLAPSKLCAMQEEGSMFINTCDLQLQILCQTAHFRPPCHGNSGYYGPWIEQHFLHHWMRTSPTSDRIYLPIFWTDLQVLDRETLPRLQEYLKHLPPHRRYYTVCQHANGLGVPHPESLDVVVFRSGSVGGHTIPLLKRELQLGEGHRPIHISFVGSIEAANNPNCIRSRTMAAFPEATHYRGPHWVHTLQQSVYSLCPRGWGPTSFRLAESIQAGAIPVILWEGELLLPFAELDWSSFAVILPIDHADQGCLEHIDAKRLACGVRAVRHMFTYQHTVHHIAEKLRPNASATPATAGVTK